MKKRLFNWWHTIPRLFQVVISSILIIMIITGVASAVNYVIITGQIEIVAGEGLSIWYDAEMTERATSIYDCGPVGRGDTWIQQVDDPETELPNMIYLHNDTEVDMVIDAEQNHSDKMDIRLWWVVNGQQRMLMTEPTTIGANTTHQIYLELYVLPTSEVGYYRWWLRFFEVEP